MNDLEYLVGQILAFPDTKVLHESYRPLVNILRRGYRDIDVRFSKQELKHIFYAYNDPSKILLYSGGKCSTALALECKNTGPLLYYVGDDEDMVKDFCKEIGLNYSIYNKEFDTDSPLYLVWIIASAITSAVNWGLPPIIYLGTFEMSSIHNNPVCMWKNCVEVIRAFEDVIKQVIPQFQIKLPLPSYSYVWDILMKNKGYLKYIRTDTVLDEMIFCIAKEDWWIEDCNDYLLYIKKLRKLYYNEVGYKASLEEFWKRYFFYDMSRSKHNPEMKKLFGE